MPEKSTSTAILNSPERPIQPEHSYNSGQKRGKSKAWIWLIVLVVLAAGGYFLYAQYQAMQATQEARQAANRSRTVPVTVTPVSKSDMNVYVGPVIGTVTPIYTDTITSRVQGQIVNIYYREGQEVHKGDPLMDIDPRPYEAALTQMEGQLAKDQAVLAEARIDLDRYQTAYGRNAIAKQQLDDQTQLVHQDEGTVQNDEGQVENAKVNLAYTHITSPIDGRVGLRLVDPGNIVQANSTTPLVVITQLEPISVIFSVDEGFLPAIQKQMRAGHVLPVDALDRTQDQKIASGTLLTVDNQIDTSTDTVKLRAQFKNTDNALFPNQFVNARLLLETQKDNTVVPSAAIQRNAQGAFVYIVQNQTASARNVTTGVSDNNLTAVSGVNIGEMIATNGFNQLQDGAKVSLPGQGRGARGGRGNRGGGSNNNAANGDPAQ